MKVKITADRELVWPEGGPAMPGKKVWLDIGIGRNIIEVELTLKQARELCRDLDKALVP